MAHPIDNEASAMRAPDRFEFTVKAIEQREVILAASKMLMKGRNAIKSSTITLSLMVLAGLGGMALAAALTAFLDVSPTWWMIVGWLAGAGLYLCSFQLLYSAISRVITTLPLNQVPQALIFDEIGMTYEAGPATWKTPWHLIDGVVETKLTITIVIGGIAFGLPKSAVGDAAAIDTLVGDIHLQIESSRNA